MTHFVPRICSSRVRLQDDRLHSDVLLQRVAYMINNCEDHLRSMRYVKGGMFFTLMVLCMALCFLTLVSASDVG